jgi:transcription elongation factor Elf1
MESNKELKEALPLPIFKAELSFTCVYCNREKPVSYFYQCKTAKRGHHATCKWCYNSKRILSRMEKNQRVSKEHIEQIRFFDRNFNDCD